MPEHAPDIFISYRGNDEPWAADFVYHALAAAFGADAVFKAGYSLRAGDVFPSILEEMVTSCRVMLVCIGPRWLAAQNAAGSRRLEEQNDWVRKEIEFALCADNHVIPLLLGNREEVVVPAPEELPQDIAPLVQRQAFRLEPGGRLRMTLPDLVTRLTELVPSLAMPRSAATVTVRQKVRTTAGGVTGARVGEGPVSPIDVTQDIDTVTTSGTVIGVEVPQCDKNE